VPPPKKEMRKGVRVMIISDLAFPTLKSLRTKHEKLKDEIDDNPSSGVGDLLFLLSCNVSSRLEES